MYSHHSIIFTSDDHIEYGFPSAHLLGLKLWRRTQVGRKSGSDPVFSQDSPLERLLVFFSSKTFEVAGFRLELLFNEIVQSQFKQQSMFYRPGQEVSFDGVEGLIKNIRVVPAELAGRNEHHDD